jgi:hypothetical protein
MVSMNDGNISLSSVSLCRARAEPRDPRAHPKFTRAAPALSWRFAGDEAMTWHIGRTEAMSDPAGARRKALERLAGLVELDDPEGLVVPILLDAILMAESYRGARHQITFLPELTKNVDALLRELTIVEKAKEWAGG